MRSRRLALALFGLLLAAGCRDLVTPEGAMNNGPPRLQVRVIGLGSDGALSGVWARIDNSAYAPQPASAEALTEDGIATFSDMPPGLYDIEIEPRYYWTVNTPPWSETAVALGDSVVTVAYEGLPVTFELDWPQLDEIAPATRSSRIVVEYRISDGGDVSERSEQNIFPDPDGLYRGFLPWAGRFHLHVYVSGPAFSLDYGHPDSIPLAAHSTFPVPSPLREHPLELRLGAGAFDASSVVIAQEQNSPGFELGHARLTYTIDRSTHPDSMYLLDALVCELEVRPASEPYFLDQSVWLDAGPVAPGPIQLGEHQLLLEVVDSALEPVVAAEVAVNSGGRWQDFVTDGEGNLELHLMAGTYGLTISGNGYTAQQVILGIDTDLTYSVELQGEHP